MEGGKKGAITRDPDLHAGGGHKISYKRKNGNNIANSLEGKERSKCHGQQKNFSVGKRIFMKEK